MRIQVLVLAMLVGTAAAQSPTPASDAKPQQAAATAAAQPAPATSCDEKVAASQKEKIKGAKGDLDPCTADLADLRKAGYTIKKQNGETLYCRKDKETGSRLKTNTFCLTAEQLRQMQANTRDGMREMTRQAGAEGN
jgi:hypothetical protein